ncbi:hypothetical protein DFH27DRAFT_580293 [Peziza echinospora]|nr:hypothetical protein DFH27DRAFT_580293 [Peziza echinospora]
MVTGIEIAGLILGCVPIILAAIDVYVEEADAIKNHKQNLKEFRRELDMQLCIFHDTCCKLFGEETTDAELKAFMNDPQATQKKLTGRLRSNAIQTFLLTVETLRDIFQELNEKFRINEDLSKEKAAGRLRKGLKKLGSNRFRKYSQEKLKSISAINSNLQILANGSPQMQLESNQNKHIARAGKATKLYSRARQNAILLYYLWKEKLQAPHCDCEQTSHTVAFQLDCEEIEVSAEGARSEGGDGWGLRSKFMFSYDNSSNIGVNEPSNLLLGSPWKCRELLLEEMVVPSEAEATKLFGTIEQNHNELHSKLHHTTDSTDQMAFSQPRPPNHIQPSATSHNNDDAISLGSLRRRKIRRRSKYKAAMKSGFKPIKLRGREILGSVTNLFGSLTLFLQHEPSPSPSLENVFSAIHNRSPSPSTAKVEDEPLAGRKLSSPVPVEERKKQVRFELPQASVLIHRNYLTVTDAQQNLEADRPSTPIRLIAATNDLVDSFCKALNTIDKDQRTEFTRTREVGIIKDNKGGTYKIQLLQHSFPFCAIRSGLKPSPTVSLAQLLAEWQSKGLQPTQKQRFQLAVQLATSVLQLHDTDWLSEGWGKDDIFFSAKELPPNSPPNYISSEVRLDKPMVKRQFGGSSAPIPVLIDQDSPIYCNRFLFSLGVLLVEINFWASIESLYSEHMTSQGKIPDQNSSIATQNHHLSDAKADQTIKAWWSKLQDNNADGMFLDAVQACVNGMCLKGNQLLDDKFKSQVWHRVVTPLKKHLSYFD